MRWSRKHLGVWYNGKKDTNNMPGNPPRHYDTHQEHQEKY
jgi:hypothetical protein